MEEVGSLSDNVLSEDPMMNAGDKGWKDLNLSGLVLRETKPSPVEEKLIQGRRVYIKRDDMLRLYGSQISGNKARKMLAMNEIPTKDFPACLVSYGGPQSNSMLALAALVNYKNRQAELNTNGVEDEQSSKKNDVTIESENRKKRFVYFTKKLPRFLRNQPSGNLFRAKMLGMEIKELPQEQYRDLFGGEYGGSPTPPVGLSPPVVGDSLWVPQGGAFGMASVGAAVLARELVSFWLQSGDERPLSVCLPGGTCATAALLHNELQKLQESLTDPMDIEVVVIPCVGDASYARRQMMALNAEIGAEVDDIPTILQPSPNSDEKTAKYFSFGQPHQSILHTFQKMGDDHGVVLDLIYGAPAWTVLLRHWNVPLGPDLRVVVLHLLDSEAPSALAAA
eukprot:scaffold26214_cov142-Cylindrotheca_fusiformis.AAC.1